jgi:hypothetical protein
MKVESLHESYLLQASFEGKVDEGYADFVTAQVHSNLSKSLYEHLRQSKGKALLVFPPKIARAKKRDVGIGYGDVEEVLGGVNYVELPIPDLVSSVDLNTLILNLIFENTKVVYIDNTIYAKCPHRSFTPAKFTDEVPTSSMHVADVVLKPVYSGKGEYLGAIGICPVCKTIYVSKGGDIK